jgi:antitoxin component of MazEF toxin-antitoxin module
MKTRLVRIGTSRGLLLPGAFIEKAGIKDEVEVTLRNGALVVTGTTHSRAGWEAAVTLLLERGEDHVIGMPAMAFDDSAWKW